MDKHIVTPEHVALWDAINNFAQAHNTERRMQVVPWIEDAIRQLLADRDAEIVNLRARLDAEASHRLSLCADNERFIAEIEMLKRRIDAQHAANGELAVDLKEWRIRFPSNDPQIARRMVEDRAVAEANMDNAGLLAEIERLRADLVVHPGCTCALCSRVREARNGARPE